MGKRPAGVELFEGNMASMQREIRPSMQRDEPPTMATGLERIADSSTVNQRPKSVVREIRTLRSVGDGGRRLPPPARWMWKRSHGRTSEAPPDERGGYRYVRPTATASHLDSTQPSPSPRDHVRTNAGMATNRACANLFMAFLLARCC